MVGRCSAETSVTFERADPFDSAFREKNPLGKVPALIFEHGRSCLETMTICRAIKALGTSANSGPLEFHGQEEADVALMIGTLDLGIAYRLESLRDATEQSVTWQKRRLEGLRAALPMINAAASRAQDDLYGYGAAALVSALDWLDFRLSDDVNWRASCPTAAHFLDEAKSLPDVASTDPRLG